MTSTMKIFPKKLRGYSQHVYKGIWSLKGAGVLPSPCFPNFLARTTFVLVSLSEVKIPGQDAIFGDFVLNSCNRKEEERRSMKHLQKPKNCPEFWVVRSVAFQCRLKWLLWVHFQLSITSDNIDTFAHQPSTASLTCPYLVIKGIVRMLFHLSG